MTVCSFFLQGRCRYGEKCWNEHPRGGRGGSVGGGDYSRGTPPSNRGGGFGNRVWVNPQRAGGDFVKPSNFAGRDAPKNSSFGVSTQNRFGALNTPSSFDRGGHKDENDKQLETIQKDMEIWESSGQWLFSCYAVLKDSISGFVELSPEELRLEYYTGRASGDLQTYGNSVQQLVAQWNNRLQELKAMNANTRSALIAELNNPGQQTSFGSAPSAFNSSSSSFGSTAPSGFGSAASPALGSTSSGFGSAASSTGFGSGGFGAPAQSSATFSFSSTQSAPSGFGSTQPAFGSTGPSASSFSFATPAATSGTTKETSSGFGASAAGFSFTSTTAASTSSSSAGGFGGVFGASGGAGGFGQPGSSTNSGLFSSGGAAGAAVVNDPASAGSLFTPQSELTADELKEFTGKRFTLGQIPLKPPPADLLVI